MAALALSGCAPAPFPLDEAVSAYDAVARDAAAAVEAAGFEQARDRSSPTLQERVGTCTYSAGSFTLLDAEKKGTSKAARVRALADELAAPLAEHGVDAPEDYQAPGGWSGIKSANDHGGRLVIMEGGGWVQISVSGPVEVDLDRCDDAALA